jgi:Domain of unknown function (DUF4861)
MKSSIKFCILFSLFSILLFGKTLSKLKSIRSEYPQSFHVIVNNPINSERNDAVIQLDLESVKTKHTDFNPYAFIIFNGEKELPSQTEDVNGDGTPDRVLFLTNFRPNEKQDITVRFAKTGKKERHYPKQTMAVLGKKMDYKLVNGKYTGGRFQDIHSTKVPSDHVAHDALYRIEGPGWESDLITYRYYLDSRNRNDLFGKKKHELILDKVGVHDLVSNSMESYTKMLDWGMDIFKVGESLGIGSIGMWYDGKVYSVSNIDSTIVKVSNNGPIESGIYSEYYGWKVGSNKYNLFSNLSICAGSRLTKTSLSITGGNVEFCTGLVKHENTNFIKSDNANSKWQYIGLYGEQSLAGPKDDLGISVFYKKGDLIKFTEDSLSYIVVLKPTDGKLHYYFAAAWDKEPNGIKNETEFKSYLMKTVMDLDNPIVVNIE